MIFLLLAMVIFANFLSKNTITFEKTVKNDHGVFKICLMAFYSRVGFCRRGYDSNLLMLQKTFIAWATILSTIKYLSNFYKWGYKYEFFCKIQDSHKCQQHLFLSSFCLPWFWYWNIQLLKSVTWNFRLK